MASVEDVQDGKEEAASGPRERLRRLLDAWRRMTDREREEEELEPGQDQGSQRGSQANAVYRPWLLGQIRDVLSELREESVPGGVAGLLEGLTGGRVCREVVQLLVALHIDHKELDEAADVLQCFECAEDSETFMQLWDKVHYLKKEMQLGRPLTPLIRFRVRQKYPPPANICPGGIRPTANLPKPAKEVFCQWLEDHLDHPYPSRAEKTLLAKRAGLSINQVRTWFANARRRLRKTGGAELQEALCWSRTVQVPSGSKLVAKKSTLRREPKPHCHQKNYTGTPMKMPKGTTNHNTSFVVSGIGEFQEKDVVSSFLNAGRVDRADSTSILNVTSDTSGIDLDMSDTVGTTLRAAMDVVQGTEGNRDLCDVMPEGSTTLHATMDVVQGTEGNLDLCDEMPECSTTLCAAMDVVQGTECNQDLCDEMPVENTRKSLGGVSPTECDPISSMKDSCSLESRHDEDGENIHQTHLTDDLQNKFRLNEWSDHSSVSYPYACSCAPYFQNACPWLKCDGNLHCAHIENKRTACCCTPIPGVGRFGSNDSNSDLICNTDELRDSYKFIYHGNTDKDVSVCYSDVSDCQDGMSDQDNEECTSPSQSFETTTCCAEKVLPAESDEDPFKHLALQVTQELENTRESQRARSSYYSYGNSHMPAFPQPPFPKSTKSKVKTEPCLEATQCPNQVVPLGRMSGASVAGCQQCMDSADLQTEPDSTSLQRGPDCTSLQRGPDCTSLQRGPDCTSLQRGPDCTSLQRGPDCTSLQRGPDCTSLPTVHSCEREQIRERDIPPTSVCNSGACDSTCCLSAPHLSQGSWEYRSSHHDYEKRDNARMHYAHRDLLKQTLPPSSQIESPVLKGKNVSGIASQSVTRETLAVDCHKQRFSDVLPWIPSSDLPQPSRFCCDADNWRNPTACKISRVKTEFHNQADADVAFSRSRPREVKKEEASEPLQEKKLASFPSEYCCGNGSYGNHSEEVFGQSTSSSHQKAAPCWTLTTWSVAKPHDSFVTDNLSGWGSPVMSPIPIPSGWSPTSSPLGNTWTPREQSAYICMRSFTVQDEFRSSHDRVVSPYRSSHDQVVAPYMSDWVPHCCSISCLWCFQGVWGANQQDVAEALVNLSHCCLPVAPSSRQ